MCSCAGMPTWLTLVSLPRRNGTWCSISTTSMRPTQGPWEWDLKRLAASAVVAGRDNGFKDKTCRRLALAVGRSYRKSMQRFSQASVLDEWYFHVDADSVLKVFDKYARKSSKSARKTVTKARSHTRQRTLQKLTEVVDGKKQIVNDPPLLERVSDLLSEEQKQQISKQDIESAWFEYINSLPEDRRRLLTRYRISDAALRVGGVGSVGTRCTIALLEGDADEDALILQQKQAGSLCPGGRICPRWTSPARRSAS